MNSIKKTLLRVNNNSKTTKEEENPIKKFKNFIFKNPKLGYNGLKKYLIDNPKKVFTQASNNNKIKTLGKWIFYITLVGPCIILAYKSLKYICIRIQRLFERTKEQFRKNQLVTNTKTTVPTVLAVPTRLPAYAQKKVSFNEEEQEKNKENKREYKYGHWKNLSSISKKDFLCTAENKKDVKYVLIHLIKEKCITKEKKYEGPDIEKINEEIEKYFKENKEKGLEIKLYKDLDKTYYCSEEFEKFVLNIKKLKKTEDKSEQEKERYDLISTILHYHTIQQIVAIGILERNIIDEKKIIVKKRSTRKTTGKKTIEADETLLKQALFASSLTLYTALKDLIDLIDLTDPADNIKTNNTEIINSFKEMKKTVEERLDANKNKLSSVYTDNLEKIKSKNKQKENKKPENGNQIKIYN